MLPFGSIFKPKRKLVDQKPPSPPFYLASEDLFVHTDAREIFLKRLYTVSDTVPRRGPVIMSPGVCTNANLFRIDDNGYCLSMDHNRSFANLLAAEGFQVYLYHPGYTDRVHNRYVARHCRDSMYYSRRYRVPPDFGYKDLVDREVPAVVDYVRKHSRKKSLSWIGYSLGGMIMYSYLSKQRSSPVRNIVSIGAPMTLNQIFFKFVPFINLTSHSLGLEEDALLGNVSQNLVPLTRAIRALPDWFVRFNLLSPFLFNPMNMNNKTVKTLLGQIIEPMPRGLQRFFTRFIQQGYSSREKFATYLENLRRLKRTRKKFLFFYGANDFLATPESVFLARETIAPQDPENLVTVPSAGHIDLILGKNANETVWRPAAEWLKANAS